MKAVDMLILLLTCIATDAENEGPSEYLKGKWHEYYLTQIHRNAPRCVRNCGDNETDSFRYAILGTDVASLTETEYMELLTNAFKANEVNFGYSIYENVTLGVMYVDDDNNGFISVEEHYAEHLCLGYEVEIIEELLYNHDLSDQGAGIFEYMDYYLNYMTNNYNLPESILETQYSF